MKGELHHVFTVCIYMYMYMYSNMYIQHCTQSIMYTNTLIYVYSVQCIITVHENIYTLVYIYAMYNVYRMSPYVCLAN